MKELLKLLVEYELEESNHDAERVPLQWELTNEWRCLHVFWYPDFVSEALLISYRYWFINWLVNVKEYPIHRDRVDRYWIMNSFSSETYRIENFDELWEVSKILAKLATSYAPISDLLYILWL